MWAEALIRGSDIGLFFVSFSSIMRVSLFTFYSLNIFDIFTFLSSYKFYINSRSVIVTNTCGNDEVEERFHAS